MYGNHAIGCTCTGQTKVRHTATNEVLVAGVKRLHHADGWCAVLEPPVTHAWPQYESDADHPNIGK